MPVIFKNKEILHIPRYLKIIFAIFADILICILSLWISYYLRLGEFISIYSDPFYKPYKAICISLIIMIPIFLLNNIYKTILIYFGFNSIKPLLKSTLIYSIVYIFIITYIEINGVPRTIGLIQPLVMFLFLTLFRFLISELLIYNGEISKKVTYTKKDKVLIYGSTLNATQIVDVINNSKNLKLYGFIVDTGSSYGGFINGIPVYLFKDLEYLVAKYCINKIIIADADFNGKKRINILNLFTRLKITPCFFPNVENIINAKIDNNYLDTFEINDFLNRESLPVNNSVINSNINNKRILVTGAGGSIGSELCQQIIILKPAILILLEINELSLFNINNKLNSNNINNINIYPILGCVQNKSLIKSIFEIYKPNTIFHSAAYKHVSLVEHNVIEGIRNNVFGTLNLALNSIEYKLETFILISTDKAVRPTNLMGATKRLSEIILQSLASTFSSTKFSIVRFGNVLGSSGSVLPIFKEQIKNGGPVTVTDKYVTRYFMSVSEAVHLVIKAGEMGTSGDIFYLDMGEPVYIYNLAKTMIEFSGLTIKDETNLNGDIEIKIIGLRQGEKLSEELHISNKYTTKTNEKYINKIQDDFIKWDILNSSLKFLDEKLNVGDIKIILIELKKIIPDFTPEDKIVDYLYFNMSK
jgi:FlaA1/EpsC-like NDP-sugar epimerase